MIRDQHPAGHFHPSDVEAGIIRSSFTRALSLLHSHSPRIMPSAITSLKDQTKIAITFDDGPNLETTPHILEVLARLNLKASFFLLGEKSTCHSTLLQAIIREGHAIGLHGHQHRSFFFSSADAITEQLEISIEIIRAATGITPRFFRPPYGKWNPAMNGVLERIGLRLVLWNCMPRDFAVKQTSILISDFFKSQIRGGNILVLHEILGFKERTETILVDLARVLERKHLNAVTLDQAFEARQQC